MRLLAKTLLLSTALIAAPAFAGEEVLYAPTPEWVDEADAQSLEGDWSAPMLLLEQQARLEEGKLHSYSDLAVALDTPEAMTQLGTLQANWMPDKGDLIIHRVDLLRDGEVIDLVDQGARFEVLRRESMLERRMLNGMLTATLVVPGAQLGDIVRLSYSITRSDQALGDEVEFASGLVTAPFPLREGKIAISWPEDFPVEWQLINSEKAIHPWTEDGYKFVEIDLPVPSAKEMPPDAPLRYHLPPLIQASSFADYGELSSVMAPHYATDGTIEPGSALAEEVSKITAQSDNDLMRAALALRLVQDEVSYLLNGLNGGNYLPQSPAETWEQRYGDCKAKSVLLLALLREMGIESEPVLIRTRMGDALPQLLPSASNFDHVIVRAVIGGTEYWLDGTQSNTRLSTMAEVPRFFYALPLRAGGSDLVELEERRQDTPDRTVKLTIDQSAGIAVPALYDIAVELTGSMAARWRAVEQNDQEEARQAAIDGLLRGFVGSSQVTERAITFDEENGVARITAKGLMASPWTQQRGRYELSPGLVTATLDFSAIRTKQEWREIPVRINGPIFYQTDYELLLPEGHEFSARGEASAAQQVIGHDVSYSSALADNRFIFSETMQTFAREVPAEQIATEKRTLARLKRSLPELRASGDVRREWEYKGKDRALLEPLVEALNLMVEAQTEDDLPSYLATRAAFYAQVRDFEAAESDISLAIDQEASIDALLMRSGLRVELGDYDGALADLEQVEGQRADGSTYAQRVELLGLLGRHEEAATLVEDFEGFADESHDAAQLRASWLGWSGSGPEGLELLVDEIALRPGDGSLLNNACWHAGIWNLASEDTLALCVEAVESSDFSAPALDSRAMAYFRLGQYDKALRDFDAALAAAPGLAEPRYMRGITRLAMGEREGRRDIEEALAMKPSLERQYKAYGIEP